MQMASNPFRYQKNIDIAPTDKEMMELLDKLRQGQ